MSWSVAQRFVLARGLLIAIAIAAPWYTWVGIRTDGAWLNGFFFEHNLGRAMSAMEGHSGGWWFYPAASLVGLFPWSLLLIPIGFVTISQVRKHVNSPAIQLGLIWLGVYMFLFSIARTKLPSYLTPSYPGAALLVGCFLAQWANGQLELSKRWLRIAAAVLALTTGLVMTSIIYLSVRENMPGLLPHALWSIGFLIVAALMIHAIRHEHQPRLPWAMLASSVVFVCGLFAVVGPTVGRYRVDLNAILAQQTFVNGDGIEQSTEWIALRPIEPSWVYYLRMPIAELPKSKATAGQFTDDALVQLVEHLQKPSGRLIVDAEEASAIESVLAERYQLTIERAVCFNSFLKSNEIVVLKRASKASGSRVYTGRARLLPSQSQARQEPRSPIGILGR